MTNLGNASTSCQSDGRISCKKSSPRGRITLPPRLHKLLSLTTQGLLRTGRAASPALPGMSGCGGRDKGRNESPHSHFYREVKKSFGGFLGGSDGKEFACNAEDLGWILGS